MQAAEVAASTTSAAPNTWDVASRAALAGGSFVKIHIPRFAFDSDQVASDGKKCILFRRSVGGGYVNLYVWCNDPDAHRDKNIVAEATIVEETLYDGRKFVAVDLIPAPAGVRPTDRLFVLAGEPEAWTFEPKPRGVTRLGNLRGFVAVADLGAKVEQGAQASVPARSSSNTKPAPESFVTTGDSQLDRLLRAGWEISTETHDDVHLWKMKGTERVEMTHFKPRRKSGNGKKR